VYRRVMVKGEGGVWEGSLALPPLA